MKKHDVQNKEHHISVLDELSQWGLGMYGDTLSTTSSSTPFPQHFPHSQKGSNYSIRQIEVRFNLEIFILWQITMQRGGTFTPRFQTELMVNPQVQGQSHSRTEFRSQLCSSGSSLSFDEHQGLTTTPRKWLQYVMVTSYSKCDVAHRTEGRNSSRHLGTTAWSVKVRLSSLLEEVLGFHKIKFHFN